MQFPSHVVIECGPHVFLFTSNLTIRVTVQYEAREVRELVPPNPDYLYLGSIPPPPWAIYLSNGYNWEAL